PSTSSPSRALRGWCLALPALARRMAFISSGFAMISICSSNDSIFSRGTMKATTLPLLVMAVVSLRRHNAGKFACPRLIEYVGFVINCTYHLFEGRATALPHGWCLNGALQREPSFARTKREDFGEDFRGPA